MGVLGTSLGLKMRTTNLRIYHLLLLLLLCSCVASTEKSARNLSARTKGLRNEPPPEGFVILPPSKDVLNHSNCQTIWEVFKEGDTTKIREQSKGRTITVLPVKIDERLSRFSSHHVQQVDDGWLIGFDAGEWGGRLLWISPDGSTKKELLRENVRGLIQSTTGVFVVTGLSHLGFSEGKIFHVEKGEDGDWAAKLLVDFRGKPHTFTQESPDSLLVVARYESSQDAFDNFVQKPGDLWRVKSSGKVELLLVSERLTGIYANSMTLSQTGVIYLGAWRFVMRLTPVENGYREEIFVPLNCY
jgi:hypothetical protein